MRNRAKVRREIQYIPIDERDERIMAFIRLAMTDPEELLQALDNSKSMGYNDFARYERTE